MRKLILSNFQSPGDIVMLTTAVRDLHRSYPGEFLTDVRTPCGHLWENNPHITPLDPSDDGAETIDCQYPLIHRSNQEPWHFLHGYIDFLNHRLDAFWRKSPFPPGDVADHRGSWVTDGVLGNCADGRKPALTGDHRSRKPGCAVMYGSI